MHILIAVGHLAGVLAIVPVDNTTLLATIALGLVELISGISLMKMLLNKKLALYREVETLVEQLKGAEDRLNQRDALFEKQFLPMLTEMPIRLTGLASSLEALAGEQRDLLVAVRIQMGAKGADR